MSIESKMSALKKVKSFSFLPTEIKEFTFKLAELGHFSFSQLLQYSQMERDRQQWGLDPLFNKLSQDFLSTHRKQSFQKILDLQKTASQERKYLKSPETYERIKYQIMSKKSEDEILGLCPVASTKTRCCNLQTLDAVQSCGFDCHYCSIQSFYTDGEVTFFQNLKEKLEKLQFEPDKYYHIGTGQSSDSLMWGNHENLLDDLMDLAYRYPKVILEFKTKSSNVEYFLTRKIPANILLTWSLNPQNVIDSEEIGTAPLQKRIEAARKAANHGIKVGFHLHPIFHYQGWEEDYREIVTTLVEQFAPYEVVTLSMGSLTFTKKVINQIRERGNATRVLQTPLTQTGGKLAPPTRIKEELFSKIYRMFKEWHQDVFFYLCMEEPELWISCLGREYLSNDEFQLDMIKSYVDSMAL